MTHPVRKSDFHGEMGESIWCSLVDDAVSAGRIKFNPQHMSMVDLYDDCDLTLEIKVVAVLS